MTLIPNIQTRVKVVKSCQTCQSSCDGALPIKGLLVESLGAGPGFFHSLTPPLGTS